MDGPHARIRSCVRRHQLILSGSRQNAPEGSQSEVKSHYSSYYYAYFYFVECATTCILFHQRQRDGQAQETP